MDFSLSDEERMLRELVARFVNDELTTLEPRILERDAKGEGPYLNAEETATLNARARELGLWGLDAPAEFGGFDMSVVAMVGVSEELGKSPVHYTFPPDSPNLRMLALTCNSVQRERYLAPYARGETVAAMAISETDGGSDPALMKTHAVKDGDRYVINGRKIWISKAEEADFTILMASTDPSRKGKGITAFLIDKGTPGYIVERRIPMISGYTYEVAIEQLEVPSSAVLGTVNEGFAPMQVRLSSRRVHIAARCCGMTRRALDMMLEWVPQRSTFGVPLSERQAIQWWIADAETQLHACRLMVYNTAAKIDRGDEARTECSMVKLFSTEMAWQVIDKCIQAFGAMGTVKELPLHLMANIARTARLYEGASEVHRMLIARRTLQQKKVDL
jgi:acyl-CoA dehydrogenase